MSRLYKTIIVLLAIMLMGWASLAAKETDALYLKLKKQAERNLKRLPAPAKKDYSTLLKNHPDRLMAFLLAYEENGRLAAADPQVVENHYRSVRELMQEQNISQPDEFFLSYVAKITVSDEAITNYRDYFEQAPLLTSDSLLALLNLKEYRQLEEDALNRYRQACLKATELLVYKPTSGRDQSPLDVATKSLYGRCEESQILFAALCRTLGIPARAASTPWWAHQDDNHAWVEVFLNGSWHYSGDSDGGYWPDQTWFTGLADKMVIITADSSLPAPEDEVLSQDEYGAVVNSIRYYAGDDTRELNLEVSDKDGFPVSNCPVGIYVYNYNSLRPIAFTRCDERGRKTITVGRGAFFLAAVKDSLVKLRFIPATSYKELNIDLVLETSALDQYSVVLEYPGRKTEFRDAPQSWKDDVKLAKQKWQLGIDSAEQAGERWRDFGDSLTTQILKKSKLNYPEYLLFLSGGRVETEAYYKPSYPLLADWEKVLLKNDEKDLWQADWKLFLKMYNSFASMFPQVKDLPEQEMLNLFEPTVFYENLPWMSYYKSEYDKYTSFYPQDMMVKNVSKPTPQQVIRHFRKRHKVNPNKALNGLLPLEIALAQKNLTAYQYKILACYYLRANGIPANYTRIPNVVSVYTEGEWRYYDLLRNAYHSFETATEQEYRMVEFSFTDENDQPVSLKPEQVQISFFKDGQFFPTNEQPDYKGNGRYETKVPKQGSFYAQIGYRNSDSLTVYYLRPLTAGAEPVSHISLKLDLFHQQWKQAEAFLKPVTDELERLGYEYAVLGSFTRENSLRMAAKLEETGKAYLFTGFEDGMVERFNYLSLPVMKELVQAEPSLQTRTVTLVHRAESGDWQMYEGVWDNLP
jgi:hypothetical protein